MKIYSVLDEQFSKYGKVIDSPYNELLQKESDNYEIPETGCKYIASVAEFEREDVLKYYKEYFGGLDIQIGYCYGRNNKLNAVEWHKCTEINVALEDMVLILGDLRDIKENVIDSATMKCFLVKKGQSVEIYQTTLHFCPANSDNKVFKSVVILPKGTNTPLEAKTRDKLLVAKNKWLICHKECTKQVELGRVVGVIGENITL